MYLSLLRLNLANRQVHRDLADCQQMHRTIMSAFPTVAGARDPRAQMGVLYRIEKRRVGVQVFVQSQVRPDWSSLPDLYLMESAQTKDITDFMNGIQEGEMLRFRLRANPTYKQAQPGKKNSIRRAIRGEEAILQWLHRKAEAGGFALINLPFNPDLPDVRVTCESYRGARANGKRELGEIRFEPVVFDGVLRVTDAGRFRQTLKDGVGPSKAYGCGLLSVARFAVAEKVG